MREGDPETVLSAPDKVVISETAAVRYFPGETPIGQILLYSGDHFTVSGVMKDMPRNSSLQTDFIFPFFGYHLTQNWGDGGGYLTFLNIQEDADIQSLETSLTQLLYNRMPLFETIDSKCSLELLADLHFTEGFMNEHYIIKGNKPMVMVLALVAFVILIISCINFTNLFISTSFIRARSVGIMKSQGANKALLIRAFYGEAAYYAAIAIAIGIVLTLFTMPLFNRFVDSNIKADFGKKYI